MPYTYPFSGEDAIDELVFPQHEVSLKYSSSLETYYLELDYSSIIEATSQEFPFDRIPEKSNELWFSFRIFSPVS